MPLHRTSSINPNTGRIEFDISGSHGEYDSGWRDISSLLVNGWAGPVYVRRIGSLVFLRLEGLDPAASTSATVIEDAPAGFFDPAATGRIMVNTLEAEPVFRRADWGSAGLVIASAVGSDALYYTWTNPIPLQNVTPPATLPGVGA